MVVHQTDRVGQTADWTSTSPKRPGTYSATPHDAAMPSVTERPNTPPETKDHSRQQAEPRGDAGDKP